jgi:hypothetical protein
MAIVASFLRQIARFPPKPYLKAYDIKLLYIII